MVARIQHRTVKVGDLPVVRGAGVLTLDTGVGWRAATGSRGRLETRWMPMNVRDRAGPTILGSHGGDTATAALLDG